MDKDLHDIDDIFKKAHQRYAEESSEAAWEKISAVLDKDDAQKYKRRFIGWKRIAIVLLFLLSGLMIYEAGIITNGKEGIGVADKSNTVDSVAVNTQSNAENESTRSNPRQNKRRVSPIVTPAQPDLQQEKNNNFVGTDLKETDVIVNSNEEVKPDNIIPKQEIANRAKTTLAKKNKLQIRNNKTTASYPRKFLAITKTQPGIFQNKKNIFPVDTLQRESIAERKMAIVSAELLHRRRANEFVVKPPSVLMSVMLDSNTWKAALVSNRKKNTSSFKPYWSVTAFASNDWSQYKLDNDVQDNNGNNQDEREEINNREKHEPSFSTGVFATRQFSKKWGVKTGLIYSSTAIGIHPQEIYADKAPDGSVAYKYITSSGYGFVKPGFGLPPAVGDSLQSTEAQHNLQSVSVPLMLTYKYDKKKISIMPSAGISANYITKATVQTEVEDALNRETVSIKGLNGMKNFYFGLVADVNLQYNANDKWSVNLLPSFKYAISPITKSNVVKTYPYSFGIGAGISYKF